MATSVRSQDDDTVTFAATDLSDNDDVFQRTDDYGELGRA